MPVHIFNQDDQAYFRWMEEHPSGFVANTGRGEQSNYFLLHRSGCHHITQVNPHEPGAFTERTYMKVCGESIEELAQWGQEHRSLGGVPFSKICGTCKPMAKTYLLVWNPSNFKWEDLEDDIRLVESNGTAPGRWSCGPSRNIAPGSRFFLMRVGGEHRGVIGSGIITSSPEPEAHWDPVKAAEGKEAWHVGIRFEVLQEYPVVAWEELDTPALRPLRKQLQASGTSLKVETVSALETFWIDQAPSHSSDASDYPDEITGTNVESLPEGAIKTVKVNQYERNSKARRLCVKHYKPICSVCSFDFGKVYGPLGEGFIHVHHLKPLNEIGQTYKVDPIQDLRPVCPNCHAMLHRGGNTLDINSLRRLLAHIKPN